MKNVVLLLGSFLVLLLCLGCPPVEEPKPESVPFSVSGTVYQDGVATEKIANIGQSTNILMKEPGVVILDFKAKTSTRLIYEVDTTLEIYYKDEFGSDVLWVSLTEDGPIIQKCEKSSAELAFLALVFLAGAVHVHGGVAGCVVGSYPVVRGVQEGRHFQVEVPFSPAAKSVVARVTVREGSEKRFTHTVNLISPIPIPAATPFSVAILKPDPDAILVEGQEQLFAAKAEGTSESVNWFWLFADGSVSSGGQIVSKVVSSDLTGEVVVFGSTSSGRLDWDTISVSTTSSGGGGNDDRGVEITAPIAGTTVSSNNILFNAMLLGNEVPASVEWNTSDGSYGANQLSFSLPVSTFGLEPGTWEFWVEVVVTYDDGEVFSNEISFYIKIEELPPPALSAQINTPTDGATLLLNQEITFEAEVSGGVPPYTSHWKFPDGEQRDGLMVKKTFTIPLSEGYVYFEVEDAVGQSYKTQVLVKTESGNDDRGVEITAPIAGTTVSSNNILFNAMLLGNEVPASVEWNTSDGSYGANQLSFSLPVSTFGLEPGTWEFWVEVVVTYDDGEVFSNEISFYIKIEELPPPALSAQINTPTDGATLLLNQEITFEAEVSGGVPPYTSHWKFPDNDHRYNQLMVKKTFTIPLSEGYVYFEVEDAVGQSYKTQVLVKTGES